MSVKYHQTYIAIYMMYNYIANPYNQYSMSSTCAVVMTTTVTVISTHAHPTMSQDGFVQYSFTYNVESLMERALVYNNTLIKRYSRYR